MIETVTMGFESIIAAVVVPTIGGLIYVIKKQADAQNNSAHAMRKNAEAMVKVAKEIKSLALGVTYCPLNNKNHDIIKKQFGGE